MLIGVTLATRKIAASATTTAAPPTTSGHRRRDDRAEHDQQRQRRQRQRDRLAPTQVRFGDRLDVAVERRPAGEARPRARRGVAERSRGSPAAPPANRRAEVEEDDVVRRVAIGRDLARRQRVRQDALDVRRLGHVARSPRPRRFRRRGRRPRSVSQWKTTTSAACGTPISVSRSVFARADSRSACTKPPARSAPSNTYS